MPERWKKTSLPSSPRMKPKPRSRTIFLMRPRDLGPVGATVGADARRGPLLRPPPLRRPLRRAPE
jgi:hypothetical protein